MTFPTSSAPVSSCIKKNILRQPYKSLSDIVILFSYSDCSNGIGFGCASSSHDEHGKKGAIKFAKQVELAAAADKKSGSDGSYPRQLLRSWTKARVVAKNKGMPGELGKAVAIPPDKEEEKKEKFKINQFNLMASDMISLNRSLQDVRMSQCKSKVSRRLFSVAVYFRQLKLLHGRDGKDRNWTAAVSGLELQKSATVWYGSGSVNGFTTELQIRFLLSSVTFKMTKRKPYKKRVGSGSVLIL